LGWAEARQTPGDAPYPGWRTPWPACRGDIPVAGSAIVSATEGREFDVLVWINRLVQAGSVLAVGWYLYSRFTDRAVSTGSFLAIGAVVLLSVFTQWLVLRAGKRAKDDPARPPVIAQPPQAPHSGPGTARGAGLDTTRPRHLARASGAGEVAERAWRTPPLYRVFFPAFGLAVLWSAVAWFDGGSDLGFTLLSVVMGVAFTAGPFLPVIRLDGDSVFARGLIFRCRIPLAEVVEVVPGYAGLTIQTADGRGFEATGVGEKWNIAAWLGKRTRSDSIAEVILEAAEKARQDQAFTTES